MYIISLQYRVMFTYIIIQNYSKLIIRCFAFGTLGHLILRFLRHATTYFGDMHMLKIVCTLHHHQQPKKS